MSLNLFSDVKVGKQVDGYSQWNCAEHNAAESIPHFLKWDALAAHGGYKHTDSTEFNILMCYINLQHIQTDFSKLLIDLEYCTPAAYWM